ncbi:MAG TPA: polymer-forming cytoskeletal protein [Candidatus Nitrosotalea sp.]|nr:polymer-forming cytoskeletal protein [Candidatus Nitrosotalea sp.]
MPAKPQDRVLLTCPHCGHQQLEPRAIVSTICRQCAGHYRAGDVGKARARRRDPPANRKQFTCFECGAELQAAASAQSTMCKRCSTHIDLRDYEFNEAVSRNFRTKGRFVVDLKGYVFNTEATVGDAVIKGRFLGKLVAERSLTFYSTAEFKGTFRTGHLVIPAGNHFRWKDTVPVGSAEIAGELAANLKSTGTVILKSTSRFYGDLEAGNLVVEEGAVVVGHLTIRPNAQELNSTPAGTVG